MAKKPNNLDGITIGGSNLIELLKNQRDPDVAEVVKDVRRSQKMSMGRRLCLRKRKEASEKPSKVRHLIMDGQKLSNVHQSAMAFINNPNAWLNNKDIVRITGCSSATTFARMSQFHRIGLIEKRIGTSDRNKRETQYKLKEVMELGEITKKITAIGKKKTKITDSPTKYAERVGLVDKLTTKANPFDALMVVLRDAAESFPQLELTITIKSK